MARDPRIPSGTILVSESDPFISKDGDTWFVFQNLDYEDRDGNMGMSTTTLCSPHGYSTEAEAEAALAATAA